MASRTKTGSGAPLTVSAPEGTQPGDLMIVQVVYDNGTSATTITAPADWTPIQRTDYGGHIGMSSYYKVAALSDPASFTWSLTANPSAGLQILAYRGVNAADPVETVVFASGDGGPLTTPSLNVASVGAVVVVLFGHDSAGATLTPAAPLVTRASSNANETALATDVQLVVPGSAGPFSATASTGNQWATQAIALRRQ